MRLTTYLVGGWEGRRGGGGRGGREREGSVMLVQARLLIRALQNMITNAIPQKDCMSGHAVSKKRGDERASDPQPA